MRYTLHREMMELQRLGLFICSFDPVLTEHLDTARRALREWKLDRIVFLPFAPKTASRTDPDGEDRREMCRAALRNEYKMEAGTSFRSAAEFSALYCRYTEEYATWEVLCLAEDLVYSRLAGKKQRTRLPKGIAFQITGEASCAEGEGDRTKNGPKVFSPLSFGRLEKQAKRKIRTLVPPEDADPAVLFYAAEKGLYLPDHTQEVRSMISEHRWIHTLGVRSTAVRLASRFGSNVLKASAAAFYHDCAKDMNIKEMRRIMIQEYACSDEETLRSSALMHGPVGAVIARDRFGITDREVLDAIRCHTTGREGMTLTDLVVFVADAIEPNRADYPGLSEIRRLAGQSLEAAALESLRRTREYVTEQGKPFNKQGEITIRALEKQAGFFFSRPDRGPKKE